MGSASSQSSYLSTLVANDRPRFAELSVEFRQQHYLAGLVLGELEMVLPRRSVNSGGHRGRGGYRSVAERGHRLGKWREWGGRPQGW